MNSKERKRIGVTRRDFIKGTAAGAVGGLVVGAAGPVLSAGSTSKPQTRGSAGRGFYRGLSAEIVQMRGHEGDMIEAYLAHPVLGSRLRECSQTLLDLETSSALAVFGTPDDLKLRSCMTLFNAASGDELVFQAVLQKFFDGRADEMTMDLLR